MSNEYSFAPDSFMAHHRVFDFQLTPNQLMVYLGIMRLEWLEHQSFEEDLFNLLPMEEAAVLDAISRLESRGLIDKNRHGFSISYDVPQSQFISHFEGRPREYEPIQHVPDTHVYLVGSDFGTYKIGYSNNPRKRLTALRAGTPGRLWLVGVSEKFHTHQAITLEESLHEKFSDKRIGTKEWFKLDIEDVEYIKAIFEGGAS